LSGADNEVNVQVKKNTQYSLEKWKRSRYLSYLPLTANHS
jgi:hypothetical protein